MNANRYAYAGGDPINNTDPTGRDGEGGDRWQCTLAYATTMAGGAMYLGGIFTAGSSAVVGGALVFVGGAIGTVATCSVSRGFFPRYRFELDAN